MRVQTPLSSTPSATTPYEHELKRNLTLSRTILFHTSPSRLLSSRSFSIALRATLRLSSSLPALRRAAGQHWHLASVAAIETNLRQARIHAAKKTNTLPLAHDVFALLCGFLGADGRPQKALQDDQMRKKKERELQKIKELHDKASKPPRPFARVASGLVLKPKDSHSKRNFGQSISFMQPRPRGFFDDEDESEYSDDKDDLFAKDRHITRVKSVKLTDDDDDDTHSPKPHHTCAAHRQADAGMRRVRSSFADYFAVRVADVDT